MTLSEQSKKIFYRTNGFIIEFVTTDKYLVFYFIKRALAFCVDIMIFIALQFLLYFLFKVSLIFSSMISWLAYLVYQLCSIITFKDKTIGSFLAGLRIGAYDGSKMNKLKKINRVLVSTIYIIPVLGWIILVLSALVCILTRGISPIDLISKTQVFSKEFYQEINKIYAQIKED